MKYISIIILSLFILTSCSSDEATPEATNSGISIDGVASGDTDMLAVTPTDVTSSKGAAYSFYTGEDVLVNVFPISHATTIVEWGDTTMYIDPAEPSDSYEGFSAPDMIFITHVHGDHLQQEVLEEIYESGVALIVPNSVNSELNEQLQEYTIVMETETTRDVGDFIITAVPAYNIREEALNYHPQDRADNGYIIEKEGLRIYFSGDSEDTPEMRALEDIDVAFVSMNLPYTMTVESAASAVLDFTPKTVFPYHYRGTDGKSDIELFKNLVNAENTDIKVVLHDWYGE